MAKRPLESSSGAWRFGESAEGIGRARGVPETKHTHNKRSREDASVPYGQMRFSSVTTIKNHERAAKELERSRAAPVAWQVQLRAAGADLVVSDQRGPWVNDGEAGYAGRSAEVITPFAHRNDEDPEDSISALKAEMAEKRATGIVDETFEFGKYKGRRFSNVLAEEPGYVEWALDQEGSTGQLARFQSFARRGGEASQRGPRSIAELSEELRGLRTRGEPGLAHETLGQLAKVKMTKHALKETGIGRELNVHWRDHPIMGPKARSLIETWRKAVKKEEEEAVKK